MGERTNISWCDHTFNGWIGCEKVSPGCKNCYAAVDTYARVSASRGLPLWGPGSSRHVTSDANWRKPLAWHRAAERDGVRRRVFCSSLSDVFEDRPDLVQPRARLIGLIRETPALDWLLLTKRPENASRLWVDAWAYYGDDAKWPPNVCLGTTCEDQRRADERIPHLLKMPAAVRFVSYEPALELVDFSRWIAPRTFCGCGAEYEGDIEHACTECKDPGNGLITTWGHEAAEAERAGRSDSQTQPGPPIDWVIVGGESGPGARPFDLAWARSVVEQCKAAGAAVFVKQLGDAPKSKLVIDRMRPKLSRKGGVMEEWPEDLRVREWPR